MKERAFLLNTDVTIHANPKRTQFSLIKAIQPESLSHVSALTFFFFKHQI